MGPFSNRPEAGRQQPVHQHRLVEPGGQNAVEHDRFNPRLVDADRFEVGLMIETTGGVVVRGAVAGRDVERHVQAAGDLVENFPFELGVCPGWLSGVVKPKTFLSTGSWCQDKRDPSRLQILEIREMHATLNAFSGNSITPRFDDA